MKKIIIIILLFLALKTNAQRTKTIPALIRYVNGVTGVSWTRPGRVLCDYRIFNPSGVVITKMHEVFYDSTGKQYPKSMIPYLSADTGSVKAHQHKK